MDILSINKQPLKKPKGEPYKGSIAWKMCLPFVDNKRAQLIHRPKKVTTYVHYKFPYLGVKAWCGNTFVGDKFTFLADLQPDGKLLCARCEAIALENGLPSAESLVGHHVHIGKLKPIRICCKTEESK